MPDAGAGGTASVALRVGRNVKDGALAVARYLPRIVGRTLLGGVAGFFVGGLAGVIVSLAAHALSSHPPSHWLALGLALVSTAACSIGGAVVGAVRAFSREVIAMVEALDLVGALYRQVRPHLKACSERVRGGAGALEARAEALRALSRDEEPTPQRAPLAERAEAYVARLIHGALSGGLLRALVGSRPNADELARWADVEDAGLERTREALAGALSRVFHGPILVALLVSALFAVAPYVVHRLS